MGYGEWGGGIEAFGKDVIDRKTQNPKHKTQNKFKAQIIKIQNYCFRNLSFIFWIYFEFRVLEFGLYK